MLNEPRTYRHSPIRFGLIILVLGTLGVGFLITLDWNNYLFLIPLVGFFVIISLFVLFSMTKKTILSEDEISSQSFLGTKSLRWNEISRVSGRGYAIKLQNFDEDVTVAPSPQLPDYEEVVEWIGIKRPDLFNPLEYSEMAKSWASAIYLPLMGLLIIGMGVFILTQASDTFVPFIILVILGIFFIGSVFTTPHSLTLDGKSLLVKYLLNQKAFPVDEIQSIELKHQSTRNGKNFFVVINLVNKKTIRISGLYPNLPVVYLVLKNWHKKNTTIGLTTQQN